MLQIDAADGKLLLNAMAEGDCVLYLGAGASANCLTSNGPRVKLGAALAQYITEKVGLEYAAEKLPEVIGAFVPSRMSRDKFHKLLRDEYTKTTPSAELIRLMGYTWARLYSWNIDDSIENVRGGSQTRQYFSGMKDKVAMSHGHEYLQVVHLHGEAMKPEHGFIFSVREYNERLNKNDHDWYRQAAVDYVSHVPIFIGSSLNEPILEAELDRARPHHDSGLGLAFLVTPDNFSPVQLEGFKVRGISVAKGTLEDFVDWLGANSAAKISPLDVAKNSNQFARDVSAKFQASASDLDVASDIIVRSWTQAKADADVLVGIEKDRIARLYLEGGPPSWQISASDIPVWLNHTDGLYEAVCEAASEKSRALIIFGQAGSGKTTAVMQALLKFSKENGNAHIYEIKNSAKSFRAAIGLISRLHPDHHVMVYTKDIFVFGDSLAEDLQSLPAGRLTLVSSVRTSEWKSHMQRHLGGISIAIPFERFTKTDHDPLIQRLLKYVPSPEFKRLTEDGRRQRLTASRSQLLIALKEATHSGKFDQVIAEEFQALPDQQCKNLALIIGIPTIARTGLSLAAAREAYDSFNRGRTFEEALASLEGIVSKDGGGRLWARHELYVRHIVESVEDYSFVMSAMIALLAGFTKYDPPVVRSVTRLDAALFKFLLNHNFHSSLARRRGALREGIRIYEEFEVAFQLDGHYWLQYGQYLSNMGELERALRVLDKSIQAYANNSYAIHAYADVQLRVAEKRSSYDVAVRDLIANAVQQLLELHARGSLELDQYPIVTLADRHIGALVKHRQFDEAKTHAKSYYQSLVELGRSNNSALIQTTKEMLAQFIKFGTWQRMQSGQQRRRSRRDSEGRH